MLNITWLKTVRLSLNLTMEDVAKEMYCTKQTISNIEEGKSSKMTMLLYEKILVDHLENSSSWDI